MSSVALCDFTWVSPSASYYRGGWKAVQVNWKRFSTESYLITGRAMKFWVLSCPDKLIEKC
jgi:hypothetical protein